MSARFSMTAARLVLASLLATSTLACGDDEIVWVPFSEEATVPVYVNTEAECAALEGDETIPAPGTLTSTVVGGTIGSVTVEPQCGPVGTEHLLTVVVGEDWEDIAQRATLRVEPNRDQDLPDEGDEERAGLEFELERDSAFINQFGLRVRSMGTADETGVDAFVITVLQPEELLEIPEDDG